MKTFNKAILAAAMSVAMGSASAATFPDFTVDEGSVAGAIANTFVADKITGNYVEVATFNPDGTFDLSLQWSAGQFVANDGTTGLNTQLGGFGASNYNMYALFQTTGTFNTVAGVTNFAFNSGGSLNLLIDADQDTTFGQPGTGNAAWTTANTVDDVLIATGAIINGNGVLDTTLATCQNGGINCGSFGTTASFGLVQPAGGNYFVLPNPFYNVSFESGQLNNFDPTGTQVINGSLDVVFGNVPEPASLALVGIGLIGFGLRSRKKA